MRSTCPDKLALPYFGTLIMRKYLQNAYFPKAHVSQFPLNCNVLYYTSYNNTSIEVHKKQIFVYL
jgi:hypothetical protein